VPCQEQAFSAPNHLKTHVFAVEINSDDRSDSLPDLVRQNSSILEKSLLVAYVIDGAPCPLSSRFVAPFQSAAGGNQTAQLSSI